MRPSKDPRDKERQEDAAHRSEDDERRDPTHTKIETHVVSTPAQGGADPTPAQTSSTGYLALGSVFAERYEVLELIGEGGMGRVYKVRDLELDRVIALKTIRSEVADDEIIRRFKQELVLARQITHKNVVRIHDLGEAHGIKYFTMEYIEGESLKDLLVRRGKLSLEEARPILLGVLGALEEAHEQGVVHRDLKPQNIVIDERGVPYIMDFGIARSVQMTGMTLTGSVLGTPHYMSPEQANGEKAGPASDLYSLGIIFYEMVTGELPFEGDTAVKQIMARMREKPKPPRQLDPSIPRYVEQVILRCLETDADLRYQSAEEVRRDLEEEQASRAAGHYTTRLQRAVWRRRSLVAALLVASVGLGLGAYLATRDSPESVASGATGAATAEPRTRIAILPLTNAAGSQELEWMRAGLPEMLVTDLSQSRFVRPVAAARIYRVLDDVGAAEQTRFDEAALQTIARRAPADYVLHGQYVEEGGTLRMGLTLWEAGTQLAVPLPFQGEREGVFDLVDEITLEVKGHLELTPEQLRADRDRPVSAVSTDSYEALVAYQEGLAALRTGASQKAAEKLEAARAEDPGFAMAHAKLAEVYLQSGRHPDAEAAIERAQRLAEEVELPRVELYQINAVAGLVRGDYEHAAENLRALAEIYPRDPDVLLELAQAHEELGALHEAIEAYEKVVDLAPEWGAALLGLGRVQVMSGLHSEAISSPERAVEGGDLQDDPEALGMAYSILGVANRDIGELDRALEHLERSLELRKEIGDIRGQAVTLFNMASIHEYRGDIESALAAERRALEMGKEMGNDVLVSQALSNMGLTYKTAGNLPKALEAFEESLKIEMRRGDHSDEANRLNQIAELYRLMGDYDLAVIHLDRARSQLDIQEHPQPQEKAINLNYTGLVKKAQGEYDEAIAAFLEALPILQEIHQMMGVATVHNNLGQIYMDQGSYANALASFEKALEIYRELEVEHDLAEVQAPLGYCYLAVGQLEEAAATLEAAEEAAHHAHAEGIMPEILLGRAKLDHARGRREAAAEAIRAFNFQANLSRQKEVAVESRIELSLLYLEEGQLETAERLVSRTRTEAADAGLRPLEAAAASARAEILLAQGKAEASRREAREAIRLARTFSGRPILWRSHVTLGQALEELGREEESLDAYVIAAETLEWIRGSLRPEHVPTFVRRPEVRAFVTRTAEALERGGREDEAASLRQWLGPRKTS